MFGKGMENSSDTHSPDESLRGQRGLRKHSRAERGTKSAEIIRIQAAAFDDAFQRADGDGFAAVLGDDDLSSVGMPPFLMAAALVHEEETMLAQYADDVVGVADWEVPAQGRSSSTSLACLRSLTGDGSNQRASASLALAMASFSVSPAVAQPGSSGNTADQRFVGASNSTSNRNFMAAE